jgi:hypothetical protein
MKELVDDVLRKCGLYSEEAAELVFLTGLVESKYKYIKQVGGPARGFFQLTGNSFIMPVEKVQ